MARRVILDVDTGTDDAVAIMFAALHPDLELLAVTTVHGNTTIEHTTDNTLRVLDWIGAPGVPVFRGLARPVARLGFPGQRHFESESDTDPHGSVLDLPAATTAPQQTGAIEYLLDTLRTTTEPLTLVAVGPLSNVATALAIEPGITEAVDELVIMGGGHAVSNVTASAEFNIWADPEAADLVFSAGFGKLTVVPLDATHRALVTAADCDELDGLGTPAGIATARFVRRRLGAYQHITGPDAAPVHDVLCLAHLVQPKVVSTSHLPVAVETSGTATVGRTVVDTRVQTGQSANAHVALDADAAVLRELLLDCFARTLR